MNSTIRTLRTIVQVLIGLAAALGFIGPVLLDSIRSQTYVPQWVIGFVVAVVAVAAIVTRLWASLEVRYPWLQSWLTVPAAPVPTVPEGMPADTGGAPAYQLYDPITAVPVPAPTTPADSAPAAPPTDAPVDTVTPN